MDIVSGLKPVTFAAFDSYIGDTFEFDAVDMAGFKEALIVLDAGIAGEAATVDVKIQERDSASDDWADIEDAAFPQITASNDSEKYVGRIRMTVDRKRYLRAVAAVTAGEDITCSFGVWGVLGSPKQEPVEQDNDVAFDIH